MLFLKKRILKLFLCNVNKNFKWILITLYMNANRQDIYGLTQDNRQWEITTAHSLLRTLKYRALLPITHFSHYSINVFSLKGQLFINLFVLYFEMNMVGKKHINTGTLCILLLASLHSSIGKSTRLIISTLWVRFPGWPTKNY